LALIGAPRRVTVRVTLLRDGWRILSRLTAPEGIILRGGAENDVPAYDELPTSSHFD